MVWFPKADYLVLASRLVPGLDGGFTIATMQRARHMAAAGVDGGRGPWLLTVAPGSCAEHDAHRAEFVRLGLLGEPERLRNLFDEAGELGAGAGAAAWLVAAARPGALAPGLEYRTIRDAAGHPLIELPVVVGDPDWHLSTAPVGVWGPGGLVGVVDGFGGLYRAWLGHVVTGLRAGGGAGADGGAGAGVGVGDIVSVPARPVVVICESRQLGELLVPFAEPGVRIVHTVHTAHTEPPHTPDAPLNPLWTRWFAAIDAFDAVLWPTAAQANAVAGRFGARESFAVVPHPAEPVAAPTPAAARTPGRVVMLNRLAPGKRVDHAIRAFARVAAQVPGARLDIYGEGPLRAELDALIGELGLRGVVRLRGHVAEASTELDDAALLLLTTAFEGQGLVVVEALSHGCPVISYDVGYGPHDMLAGGGGVLVPSGDVAGLADAVVRVLGDAALRESLGAEAIAAARRMDVDASMSALAGAVARALDGPVRR